MAISELPPEDAKLSANRVDFFCIGFKAIIRNKMIQDTSFRLVSQSISPALISLRQCASQRGEVSKEEH